MTHSESYKDFQLYRIPAAPPLVAGIELRHAVQTAVSTLFGPKWVAEFRAGEISAEIAAKGGKASRGRRW
ncbi:MAG: hypothetical protein ACJ8CO_16880, partial [Microvirga sp.]